MAKKSSAADRTVSLFGAQPTTPEERPIEVVEDETKADRVSMEESANDLRDRALKVQEWATAAFGSPDAQGNEYRVSHKGQFYYLETLAKRPGMASAYGYVGVVLHERDLLAATQVLVQAVREKQARDAIK